MVLSLMDLPVRLHGLRPFVVSQSVSTIVPNGRYHLMVRQRGTASSCGWFRPLTPASPLAEVAVAGVPLPEDAVNFGDKIALLDMEVPETELTPGGQLDVTLTWQAVATDIAGNVLVRNCRTEVVNPGRGGGAP